MKIQWNTSTKNFGSRKVELYSNSCLQNFISNDNLQETSAWVPQVFLIFFFVGLLPMVLHRNRGGLWVCSIPYFWVESMEEYVCINLFCFFWLVGEEIFPGRVSYRGTHQPWNVWIWVIADPVVEEIFPCRVNYGSNHFYVNLSCFLFLVSLNWD